MNYQSGITHHSLMCNQSCRRRRSRKYIVHGIVAVNQQRHTGADRLAPTSGVRVGQQLTYDPTGVPNGSRLSRRPSGHAASPHTDAGRCGHASSKSSRTHHVRDMRGQGDTMSRRTTSPPPSPMSRTTTSAPSPRVGEARWQWHAVDGRPAKLGW